MFKIYICDGINLNKTLVKKAKTYQEALELSAQVKNDTGLVVIIRR